MQVVSFKLRPMAGTNLKRILGGSQSNADDRKCFFIPNQIPVAHSTTRHVLAVTTGMFLGEH
jgi:hypothetical protein